MASECGPAGFTSVKHSFSWPTVFLKRICGQFGEGYVAQRLRQWRWSCSTAFSGVGAPESVSTPAVATEPLPIEWIHYRLPS